jgi:hypothetical protein
VKGGIKSDDLVADNLGALDTKVVENRSDPFRDSGHVGAGHAAGGGADAFDSRLGEDLGEQSAEILLGCLRADPQTLDGTVFSVSQNLFAIHNRGAGTGASAINSKNQTHLFLLP